MNRSAFFTELRKRGSKPFGTSLSASQVKGIEGILDAFATHGDGFDKTLAYALATAFHETGGRMVPVREGFAKDDASARRIVAKRKYGQPTGKYGHVYYGRGQVQLTWLKNYEDSSKDAGYDLVAYPDQMLDPVISARVLIKGLLDGRWNASGRGIHHYLPLEGSDDLRNARRTVNITDKWDLIGGYYKGFLASIRAAGGIHVVQPKPAPIANLVAFIPDEDTIIHVQEQLKELGYNPGGADGKLGPLSKGAILSFRNDNGLPAGDGIDGEFLTALAIASPRKMAPERANATPAEVTAKVPEAKAHWWTKWLAAGAGVPTIVAGAAEQIAPAKGYLSPLQEMTSDIPSWVWFGAVGAVALAIFLIARRGEAKSVEAFQNGERR